MDAMIELVPGVLPTGGIIFREVFAFPLILLLIALFQARIASHRSPRARLAPCAGRAPFDYIAVIYRFVLGFAETRQAGAAAAPDRSAAA